MTGVIYCVTSFVHELQFYMERGKKLYVPSLADSLPEVGSGHNPPRSEMRVQSRAISAQLGNKFWDQNRMVPCCLTLVGVTFVCVKELIPDFVSLHNPVCLPLLASTSASSKVFQCCFTVEDDAPVFTLCCDCEICTIGISIQGKLDFKGCALWQIWITTNTNCVAHQLIWGIFF